MSHYAAFLYAVNKMTT